MKLNLVVLENKYSIYRFEKDYKLPGWVYDSDFYSIAKTSDELSVVTIQNDSISEEIKASKDWRVIKVIGPLDFSLTGIIAGISQCLKQEGISIFTISTYDTDYVLVKAKELDNAVFALKSSGYNFASKI